MALQDAPTTPWSLGCPWHPPLPRLHVCPPVDALVLGTLTFLHHSYSKTCFLLFPKGPLEINFLRFPDQRRQQETGVSFPTETELLLLQTHSSWAAGPPCDRCFPFRRGLQMAGSHRPGLRGSGSRVRGLGRTLSQSPSLTLPASAVYPHRTPGQDRTEARFPGGVSRITCSDKASQGKNSACLRAGRGSFGAGRNDGRGDSGLTHLDPLGVVGDHSTNCPLSPRPPAGGAVGSAQETRSHARAQVKESPQETW